MTIEELEKYCVEQSMNCEKNAETAETEREERFYAGQANAFMWIAAVVQQNKPRETPH